MIAIYEETQIRERIEKLNKFNKYVEKWEKNFRDHIEALIIVSKHKDIKLEKIKDQIKSTLDSILDEYHEIEKYNKL